MKVALVRASDGSTVGTALHPDTEMPIASPRPDWAEQNPDDWWVAACAATRKLLAATQVSPDQIAAIGIAYQMHGLVCVDARGEVLRPAIIWCDSRAVSIGSQVVAHLDERFCLENYLNTPGNFTASKLRWVQENEPDIFARIHKIMLPGDYIAYRMSGEIATTISGLSEGVLWDFRGHVPARALLEQFGIPESLLPDRVPTFGFQGKLGAVAAVEMGLVAGIPIGYRAGDQPNNAFSLQVLRPGEVAATGGTSGVVYAVAEQPVFDPRQRVNSFAHVNYAPENPFTGILLCINGAGSLYRWVRQLGAGALTYPDMEALAAQVPVGSEGLRMLPFGNGAERMLGNQNPGAQLLGLQVNRHEPRHLFRAALEGIAFAFVYGMEAMRTMGIPIHTLRVGNDNLFQSAVFSHTMATLMNVDIDLFATTGAVGAAKGAGVSVGIFQTPEEAAAKGLRPLTTFRPDHQNAGAYRDAYAGWLGQLRGVVENL